MKEMPVKVVPVMREAVATVEGRADAKTTAADHRTAASKAAAMKGRAAAAEAAPMKRCPAATEAAAVETAATAATEADSTPAVETAATTAAVPVADFNQPVRGVFRGGHRARIDQRKRLGALAGYGRQREHSGSRKSQATDKAAPGIWNLHHV
jgi:hypothetical protein